MIRALLILFLLGLSASPAAAQTYTLTPTQDTDVRQNGGGTNNCGSCTQIQARTHSTGEHRALYQFDLASIPSGARLVSATLRIWVTASENTAVSVHSVTQTWSEATLTWQNGNAGVLHNATAAASFTPAQSGRYYDVDIASLVGQWRSGTANYGLILKMGGSNALAAFTTRESANVAQRPQLVIVTQPPPSLSATPTTSVTWDAYNGGTNPKLIPGSLALRSVRITNSSTGYPDADSTVTVHRIPTETALFVRDLGSTGSGPVAFAQGMPSSTLTYSYTSLSSTTDDIAFSNNNGASYSYTPVPDASGYDAAVTHIRVSPRGTFAGSSSAGNPSFTLSFRIKVK